MADYDNPRPSSQPIGSTDPAVVKDNLITIDYMVESDLPTVTTRTGKVRRTLAGLYNAATGIPKGDYAIGVVFSQYNEYYTYDNGGTIQQWSVKDTVALPYTATFENPNLDSNLTLTGSSVRDYGVLPAGIEVNHRRGQLSDILSYTPGAGEIIADEESGDLHVGDSSTPGGVSYALSAVARSLNVSIGDIIFDADKTNAIPQYIYSQAQQRAYKVPSGAIGKLIDSVSGNILTTSDAFTYELVLVDEDIFEKTAYAGGNLPFRKSLFANLPFRDSNYDTLKSTYNYDYIYPQSIAVDAASREIFILKGANSGDNTNAWVWVYDMDTLAVKTVFSTGKQWRECAVIRTTGGVRYFYTIDGNSNSVIRIDVTTLPTNLSVATIADSYAVNAQSMMFWDGTFFYVQSYVENNSLSRRNIFDVYDADFSAFVNKIRLPLNSTGVLHGYINYFPKLQGITSHRGRIFCSVGGAYDPSNATHVANQANSVYLTGSSVLSQNGDKIIDSMIGPTANINLMSGLCGFTNTVSESEGFSSSGGKLYGLYVTLGPSDREAVIGETYGLAVTIEHDDSLHATDYSGTAFRMNQNQFDEVEFQSFIHHSSSQLINPITGNTLDSFQDIIDMMRQADLSIYKFNGSNQTLVDINNNPISVSGTIVTFESSNGFTFIVSIEGVSFNNPKYAIQNAATTPTQVGPLYDTEVISNSNGLAFKEASGRLTCQATLTSDALQTAAGNIFRANNATAWTYPEPFLSGTVPVVMVGGNNGIFIGGSASATPSDSAVNIIIKSYQSSASGIQFSVLASGRWK